MANNTNKSADILKVSVSEQYRTVEELFEKSRPSPAYYTLLILAVFIVAPGLLLNNGFIVIGGMLVAPVLTPVLLAALGLAVGQTQPIKDAAVLMIKSFILVILGGLILALVFGTPQGQFVFENTMRTAVLYFIVAVAAGMIATLAWVRQEIGEGLTGIAIALSLVPPLALVGIRLGALDLELTRYYFLVFLFNLIGVIVGSIIIFNMLKFYRSEKKVEREADEHRNQASSDQ